MISLQMRAEITSEGLEISGNLVFISIVE